MPVDDRRHPEPDTYTIYNPTHNWSELSQHVQSQGHHIPFLSILAEKPLQTLMHRRGTIVFPYAPANDIAMSALFDTGATSSNYMSKSFLQNHSDYLQPYIQPYHARVKLGDNKTVMTITTVVKKLTVAFIDPDGQQHLATTDFQVLDTGNDIIIGLPTILTSLSSFFYNILMHAVEELATEPDQELSDTPRCGILGDVDNPLPAHALPQPNEHILPFAQAMTLSPEEQEDEEPCILRYFADLTAISEVEAQHYGDTRLRFLVTI